MSINTASRRRSAIDFGKGPRGAGMPIPVGFVGLESRANTLNLYPGIAPVSSFFFFWRNRHIAASSYESRAVPTSVWGSPTDATTQFEPRSLASSTWGKGADADEDIFVKATEVKDT